MNIDLDKLEQVARAATIGPWGIGETHADNGEYAGLEIFAANGALIIDGENAPGDSDTTYIAANPAVVIELVRRLRAAEADAARYRYLRNDASKDDHKLSAWISTGSTGTYGECGHSQLDGGAADHVIDEDMAAIAAQKGGA